MGHDSLKTVAVMYGGRSVEHEISIISALQIMGAIDVTRYNVVPVYIAPNGHWYTGDDLFERAAYKEAQRNGYANLTEVLLPPWRDAPGVMRIREPRKQASRWPLDKSGSYVPIDVFLLAFHGEYGEDGCIQGLLELGDRAYTSCNVLASAVAMNKSVCKSVLRDHGVAVLPGAVIRKAEVLVNLDQSLQRIKMTKGLEEFPLFVKPANLGSSIGITKAVDRESLVAGLALVFRHDEEALVEPFVDDMFEINVSVLDGKPPRASVVEIPLSTSGILTYEDKYAREGGKKNRDQTGGMANLVRSIDPADLGTEIKETVIGMALKSFHVLGCSGVVRFDFMHDNRTGQIYFNELNTIPGSLSFYLWSESQPPLLYTEELTIMIDRALERRATKLSLEKNVGFKTL